MVDLLLVSVQTNIVTVGLPKPEERFTLKLLEGASGKYHR
jgi:hypothetical protein